MLLAASAPAAAQPNLAGSAETRLALKRLNVLGSVLMIGAHPDDEHTGTLAYLARGRGLRTAYLSLTRGEGGQNLIGPEQGAALGVIRTQELLAARGVDGAEQYFTRAIDFGYSKSAAETLEKWGRDKILADTVWVIRRFRPDVVILCFSGTPRDGHGMHEASAILGKEAFAAAADPKRFPEQLHWVEPWQAKRALWNVWGREAQAPGHLSIDIGDYNPLLGHSYGEIAGMSRSMHRSQAMGSPERRGPVPARLLTVAGDRAEKDPLEGVDTSWRRVPGAEEAGRILARAEESFDPERPDQTVPALIEARRRLAGIRHFWAERKCQEIDAAIALAMGLWLEASAAQWDITAGSQSPIQLTALNRSRTPARLAGAWLEGQKADPLDIDLGYNQPYSNKIVWAVPPDAPPSQPFWLVEPPEGEAYTIREQLLIGEAESPPALRARFRLRIAGEEIEYARPVRHRYVDRARGELTRPIAVVPPVSVEFSEPVVVLPDSRPRPVELLLTSNAQDPEGRLAIELPEGVKASPESASFKGRRRGERSALDFMIAPSADAARGRLRAVASLGNARVSTGMQVIEYPHIDPQVLFPPAEAALVRADIRILAKRIGYIMGAGDEIPGALRQLGCEVVMLRPQDLSSGNLRQFDAIVAGVRAYNVRPDFRASFQRLLDYAAEGGTLVVQYVRLESQGDSKARVGPYPMDIGRSRVSVEEAPVTISDAASPLLSTPNRIAPADFKGWVQERGLYLPSSWDSRYKTLFESHDPGEPPQSGGVLYTPYGKGAYVFTTYSWFRQLPAGVPGAFRIFANLLSASKALEAANGGE